jgi:hypothetical protein
MDVRDRLRQLMDDIPPLADGDPEATFGSARQRVRRRRTLALGGGGAVALVVVALLVLADVGPRLPLISDTPDASDTGVEQVPAGWVTITAGEIAVSVPPDWEVLRRYENFVPPEGTALGGPCYTDLYRPGGLGGEPQPQVPVAVVYGQPTDGACPLIGFEGPPPRPGLVLFETIRGTVDGVEGQPGSERVDIEQRAVQDRIGQLKVWRSVDDEQGSDLEPSGIVSYVPVELQGGLWVSHPDDPVVQRILTTARPADGTEAAGSETGPPTASENDIPQREWILMHGFGPRRDIGPSQTESGTPDLGLDTAASASNTAVGEARWTATDGCRQLPVRVQVTDGQVQLLEPPEPIAATADCTEDQREIAAASVEALLDVSRWEITNDLLILEGAATHLTYRPASPDPPSAGRSDPEDPRLWEQTWIAQQITGADQARPLVPGTELIITFNRDDLRWISWCKAPRLVRMAATRPVRT